VEWSGGELLWGVALERWIKAEEAVSSGEVKRAAAHARERGQGRVS
jgi:hypothetical protein